ncbi:amidase-like [Haliotis rufescens]|uniref:amidase-like n=1 Tax=Haliotis rufescens TaxID=6454 RepID=UPI001EAF90A4|nr:amidase-like [Haliotis rufescens]
MAELTVSPPSLTELRALSDQEHLECTEEELVTVQECFNYTMNAYAAIWKIPEPRLEVKYPRTTGQMPTGADNPYNAWFVKCEVQRAESGALKDKIIGISDNIALAEIAMNPSALLGDYVPEYDATVVTRILSEGGEITGKTANSSTSGSGVVENPHDTTRLAGTADSGGAALVSGGQLDMAVGLDHGGSLRIASSWTGIVGLKPTYGLVPYTGIIAAEVTLDHVGPMAKTVGDCAALLEVLSGTDNNLDPRQPTTLKSVNYSRELEESVDDRRIGLLKEGFDLADEEVAKIVMKAAMKLKTDAAEVDSVSVPEHVHGRAIWGSIFLQGSIKTLTQGKGIGDGFKGYYPGSLHDALTATLGKESGKLPSTSKAVYLTAKYVNQETSNRFYCKAQNLSLKLKAAYDRAFEKYDVLVMPTVPFIAPTYTDLPNMTAGDYFNGMEMVSNTSPFNCTGHPALTINAGTIDGLPVGMMLVGRHFDEKLLLRIAKKFEGVRDPKEEDMETPPNEA